MLVLSGSDVRKLVSMPDAIALMKAAFGDLSKGLARAPVRSTVSIEAENAVSLFMPASVPSLQGLGHKLVSVFPNNAEKGKPVVHALVCLVSPQDGTPLAVMDGTYITALRTGAVSGAASDLLARPNASVLAMFGAGTQALAQIRAVCAVRQITNIRLVVRSEAKGAEFIQSVAGEFPDIAERMSITTHPGVALSGADIVCTATPAISPLFDDADINEGTHINAVGAFTPRMQEIPAETVARSLIVVDEREAAWEEAGDLIAARDRKLITEGCVHADLGELVNGAKKGRTSNDQVTFFKSVGNAVQDVAVARRAFDLAQSQGIGQSVLL